MDASQSIPESDESTPRSGHTSGHSRRIEVITRAEPRRSWTIDQKREIVAESLGPDLTPAEVARKHSIGTGQLYTWRRQLLGMQSALVRTTPHFTRVELAEDPPYVEPTSSPGTTPSVSAAAARPEGLIEVVLADGVVIRVDAHVDGRALRRVLGALEGR